MLADRDLDKAARDGLREVGLVQVRLEEAAWDAALVHVLEVGLRRVLVAVE